MSLFMVNVTINGAQDYFEFDGDSAAEAKENCVLWFKREYPDWVVVASSARALNPTPAPKAGD